MKKNQKQITNNNLKLFKEIREIILFAKKSVVRNVNTIQVITYFEIGRRIVEQEQNGEYRAEYGKAPLKDLSNRLTKELGKGFSRANIQNMRNFYIVYNKRVEQKCQMPSGKLAIEKKSDIKSEKSQTLPVNLSKTVFSLSWSQYVFLLGIKDQNERNFYEIEAANNGWTLPELTRQFNSGLYERLALSRNKDNIKKLSKEGQIITKSEDLLKEPYVLEFLGLDEKTKYSESDLETAIIDKLENFY
jgi:hypothetical protein